MYSSQFKVLNVKKRPCFFIGDVVTNVVYELTSENSLEITFTAMTNKPTLVNMGSHCFFNLGTSLLISFTLSQQYT